MKGKKKDFLNNVIVLGHVLLSFATVDDIRVCTCVYLCFASSKANVASVK